MIDVAAGERRLVEVIDERLLTQRQRRESVGVQLHDGGIVDLLEQIRALGRRGWRDGGRTRAVSFLVVSLARTAGRENCRRDQQYEVE